MRPWMLLVAAFGFARVCVAQEDSFEADGVRIRYYMAGEGEPVVLIHGWMGDSSMWGRDAAGNPKLSPLPGFKAIAVDCRGHGKSDKPHDPKAYGSQMAEDVVRLLDHLKIRRAHLVGYSMGAFIAGKVVASHPDRVKSVTYGGQAPLLDGEAGAKEIDVFCEAVEAGTGLGPYLQHVRPNLSADQAQALAKFMFAGKDTRALAAAGRSFKGLEVSAGQLIAAKTPSLFLYGSGEDERIKRRISSLRPRLENASERKIEGGDHVSTPGKPGFGEAIVEFLRANSG